MACAVGGVLKVVGIARTGLHVLYRLCIGAWVRVGM